MTEALRHRGPDDEGYWTDPDAGIGLGHRRLAILDLSPEARQPMRSASGRYVIVFNGEVYNFGDLRADLEHDGARFRGHSDTEVMLAAVERWGMRVAVQRFAGMFAFALWDARDCALHLVRDRLGEKPLYYGWMGHTLLFGSELKALRVHPEWQGKIDRGALALYLRHSYIPSPYSVHQGVRKVSPGTIVTVRPRRAGEATCESRYWSAREVVERGLAAPLAGSETEIVGACECLLREVIKREMVADVPLGAFLSGGIDSSTVVALMQAQSSRPVRTFTVGFHEREYNEADHAKTVAAYLGTEHTELYVTPQDMLGVIARLPLLYDEPFADSSQIPTFLVAQMTRNHVTVSLSGDGGDELFGGYTRYFQGERVWRAVGALPLRVRRVVGAALDTVPRGPDWSDRLHKLARVLRARTVPAMYREVMSQDGTPALLVPGSADLPTVFTEEDGVAPTPPCVLGMMYLDLVSYLPDDILVKVDRASMGVSLESRAPFLDHQVVELAWRVPLGLKIRHGQGKWLLRQVLYRYVPKDLVERPKRGFGVPLHSWLSGPLREWSEDLLTPSRLRREGFLNAAAIAQLWARHCSGSRRVQDLLWTLLMFEAWFEAQGSSASG
jgi:asparagine synthase (glutamine-hydrolysing)